jgi:hypothetical protein
MFERRPLWYRIFVACYALCAVAYVAAIPVVFGLALWKRDSGWLIIALTMLFVAGLAVWLIRNEP